MALAPLDNQIVFQKLFQDPEIITAFVKDLIGIDIIPTTIEVGKQFAPLIRAVDLHIDVFVEDPQHRFVLQIQRVRYDCNYDRLLYYHYATTLEIGKKHRYVQLDRTVYTIVWLTSPTTNPQEQFAVITNTYHSTSDCGKTLNIYPHALYFLNHHYVNEHTPAGVAEWMQLMQASMNEPKQQSVESKRAIIQKAALLMDNDGLTPQERVVAIEQNEYEAHLNLKYHQGEKKAKQETARKILAKGFPMDEIAELTGLSQEDIVNLTE